MPKTFKEVYDLAISRGYKPKFEREEHPFYYDEDYHGSYINNIDHFTALINLQEEVKVLVCWLEKKNIKVNIVEIGDKYGYIGYVDGEYGEKATIRSKQHLASLDAISKGLILLPEVKIEEKRPVPKKCCEKMENELYEENIISVMTNKPFRHWKKTPPTVYILSDGGHDGILEISYCPFCGTKIEFE